MQQHILSSSLATFALFTLFQLHLFALAKRYYPLIFTENSKPIAWLLTWNIGVLVIPASIPFTYSLLVMQDLAFASNLFSHVIASAFLSFLLLDLVLGHFHYPKRLQLVAGWIHHLVYMVIILDFMRSGIPGLLGTFCVLEVPTFIMALGNLNPAWRSDRLFGFLFFMTRILYHALVIYHFCFFWVGVKSRFFVYSALSFPMHCYWFYRFALG